MFLCTGRNHNHEDVEHSDTHIWATTQRQSHTGEMLSERTKSLKPPAHKVPDEPFIGITTNSEELANRGMAGTRILKKEQARKL